MLLEGLMEPLSDSKQAALQQAAHGGDAQPVQKLLLQGTDVHAQNPKVRMVNFLLKHVAKSYGHCHPGNCRAHIQVPGHYKADT